jgi:hypothetical protein
VNHDKGGFKGGALRALTRDAEQRSLDASPLGAFVKYVKTCHSVDEVKARCAALLAAEPESKR